MSLHLVWVLAACAAAALFGVVVGGCVVWRAMRQRQHLRHMDTHAVAPLAPGKATRDVLPTPPPLVRPMRPRPLPEAEQLARVRPSEPTPIPPPPEVAQEPEENGLLDLSDDEIDALPPTLQSPTKPRRRILPPPKGHTWRNL